ncbi:MAG: GNAT family N-acetyltransferase [Bacteroidetes bacterium]|nr:GNAT family N-acetyltransferase [Bacteroidota bacterium]
MSLKIRQATINDIPLIQDLTYTIWPVTYGSIVSKEQLKYMLELIYSDASLQKQMQEGHHYIVVEDDKKPVAFADYGFLEDKIFKLHKIYVLPDQQGKSIGKFLINQVIDFVKQAGATTLVLNVNRHNKAKQFYEHLGFTVLREDDIDIGEGYFMNDYIMGLDLGKK